MTFDALKEWYDGYFLSDGGSLFNTRSVEKALPHGTCLNYWTETGPMNEITDCIKHNTAAVSEDIVKMVARIPVEDEVEGYSA
ncbi:MAG: AAA family ATPase, partial [Lachnospiraceae bacterium]|nr:AAA family ATPase [Lachnospiraceae bacterium]